MTRSLIKDIHIFNILSEIVTCPLPIPHEHQWEVSVMPYESTRPTVELSTQDIWGFIFERPDQPFPNAKGIGTPVIRVRGAFIDDLEQLYSEMAIPTAHTLLSGCGMSPESLGKD